MAYNNEKGGVIERLKQDGTIDMDSEVYSVPDWISTKAMLSSWLADALKYELWVGSDGTAEKIYCSDLPWPIGKALFFKQVCNVKKQLGITKDNAEQKEEEVSSFLFVLLFHFFLLSLYRQTHTNICMSMFISMYVYIWKKELPTRSTFKRLVAYTRGMIGNSSCIIIDILLVDRFTGKQALRMELCQLS